MPMPTRALVLLACVALVASCQQATAPAPDYRPGEAGTVDHALCLLGFKAAPLREVSTGHHLVQATINGKSGSFVLDTGANVTVVDRSRAEDLGISDSRGPAGLAGGVTGGLAGGRSARQVSIDAFRIGSVEVRQQRIVTADLGELLQALSRVSGTTVYGLVGQDVLTEHRAIVDVAKPMLYLMAEDRDPAPVSADRCRDESGSTEVG